jgi:hypothetical protein
MTSSAVAAAAPDSPKHSTDLGSYVDLHNDYSKSAGSMNNALVLRGGYAPVPWAGLQLDLPLVYAETSKTLPVFGIGDVSGRVTVRIAASETSLLAGTTFAFDSAAAKGLGGGKNVIGPFATVAWDFGPSVWVRLQLQHLASFGGDPNQPPVSASSVRPYAYVELPEDYWLVLDQTFRVDHKGPQDLSYSAVLEGGKSVSKKVSVYLDPGVEIASPWALTWMMTAGVRWSLP